MASERTLTVMFTDMKGYTARAARSSRKDLLRMLREHDQLVLPVLELRGGTLIKTIGDAFMVKFSSARHAVLAAIEVQATLRAHNSSASKDDRIDIRIGLHTGVVAEVDGDLFGNTVNVAARIESMAKPGSVFFSEAVFEQLSPGMADVVDLGRHPLKGVPKPVRILRIRTPGAKGKLGAWYWRCRRSHVWTAGTLAARAGWFGAFIGLGALGAALHSPWLAAVAAGVAAVAAPIRRVWPRRIRAGAVALAVAVGVATAPSILNDATAHLEMLAKQVRRHGSGSLETSDRAAIYGLHALGGAASWLMGSHESARARLAMHLDGPAVRSDPVAFPMQSPKVVRTVARFAARVDSSVRRGSQAMRVTTLDLRHDRILGTELPAPEMILRGEAHRHGDGWRLDITALASIEPDAMRRVSLLRWGEHTFDIHGNLLGALTDIGWLHSYTRSWTWSVRSDDQRFKPALGMRRAGP